MNARRMPRRKRGENPGALVPCFTELVSEYGMEEGAAERLSKRLSIIRDDAALPPEPLGRPEAVARYINIAHAIQGQEILGAIFLNGRNGLIADEVLFRGTMDRAAVEPAAILRRALLLSASGLVLFHTHPSGDPTPSLDDLAFTGRLANACKILGLRLCDHIVVGRGGRWISLRQCGSPADA